MHFVVQSGGWRFDPSWGGVGSMEVGRYLSMVNTLSCSSMVERRPVYAPLAQLVEQLICNQQVAGSSPVGGFSVGG